jgi:hypothetical protein
MATGKIKDTAALSMERDWKIQGNSSKRLTSLITNLQLKFALLMILA